MRKNNSAFFSANCTISFSIAILWTGILTPTYLQAQDANLKLSNDSLKQQIELKEVAIRSAKNNKRQTSSTPLQILSGSDLQKLNSLSVADAMKYFSGVQIKDYGGIGGLKTIDVRSLGTNHTGVFYDGVELGNAQNGQVDLGKYSLDNIDEIELYSGQKSTIFQSAKAFASANTIYLKTKDPIFTDDQKINLSASIKSGSFGLFNPSLLIQNKLSEALSSSISTEYTKANGRYKFRYTNGVFDTTAIRNNGDVERLRLELGLKGNFKDSSTLSTRIYLYTDEMGLPGAIVSNKFNYLQRTWNKNAFIQSTYQKHFSKNYSLLATAKLGYDYNRYLDPESVSLNGFLDNTYKQQEAYISLVHQYSITKIWTVALATDYQFNKLDANIYRFPYPTRNTLLGAFASHLNLNRLDLQANVVGTLVQDHVKDGSPAGKSQKITPALMLSWQPFESKEFRIRSFYKTAYRLPTFNDLYYTDFGRTYLRPEYARQYDVGLTYIRTFDKVLKQLSIQSDAYFNKVKDKIVAVPGNNAQRWSIENIGDVDIKGLDVNLQTTWQANQVVLTSGLNYTYQDAKDLTRIPAVVSYKRQLPYIPRHSGSVVACVVLDQLALNYSFIYTGERYNQKANIVANHVEPWYTHDVSVRYAAVVNKSTLKLSAEVNNLFNQYYDVMANFPMPGRSYRITLNLNY
ncbi:TonB-dependent receptor plug domain-containing protein [Pedobacter sp. PWIIR3]